MAFRRTKKLTSFLKLNISGSGPSFTLGRKGFGITFGPRGTYMHTGIPGTGLYSRKKISTNELVYTPTDYEAYEFDILGSDGVFLLMGGILTFLAFIWTLQIEKVLDSWINMIAYVSVVFISLALLYKSFKKLFDKIPDIEKAAYILVRHRKIDSDSIRRIEEKLNINKEQAKALVEDLTIWGVIAQPDLSQEGTLSLHTNKEVKLFFKQIRKDSNSKQKFAELQSQRQLSLKEYRLKYIATILSRYEIKETSLSIIKIKLDINEEQVNALVEELSAMGLITPPDIMQKRKFLLRNQEEIESFFEHTKEDVNYPQKWAEQYKQKQITEALSQIEKTTNNCRKRFIEGYIAECEGQKDAQIYLYNYTIPQTYVFAELSVISQILNYSEQMWRNENGLRIDCHFLLSKFNGINPNAIVLHYKEFFYYIYPHIIVKARSSMDFSILPIQNCFMHYSTMSETTYSAPSDAKVLGYTYEKVNKDGSKDLRYKDNRKLTIVEYGIIEIPRLNVKICVSNSESATSFVSAYNNYLIATKKDYPIEIDDVHIIDNNDSIAFSDTEQNLATIEYDPLLYKTACLAIQEQTISISHIQRQLNIGFNRCNRIMNQLELIGIVSENKDYRREVLVHNIDTVNDIMCKFNIDIEL